MMCFLNSVKNLMYGAILGFLAFPLVFVPLMAAYCPRYLQFQELFNQYLKIWVSQ